MGISALDVSGTNEPQQHLRPKDPQRAVTQKKKVPTLFDDVTREKSGTGRRPVRSRNYEPDSLTSCLACCVAFLDSELASACGSNVWMALPRLIFVVFVHVDVAPTAVCL